VLFEEITSIGLHNDVLIPHCEMITTCMFTYVLEDIEDTKWIIR